MTVPLSNSPPYPGDDHRVVARVFALSDVGRTRDHNEDSFLVAELDSGTPIAFEESQSLEMHAGMHGLLFLVADGMGGAASGELASSMATYAVLDVLRERWLPLPATSPEGFATVLRDSTEAANSRIHQYARENPEHRGMGTTATVAGLMGDRLFLAQVGDSRAYLVREGRAIQITKDQSLMQRLVEAGELTQEEAEASDRRNIILQALGPEAQVTIDLTHQQVRRGDTLVLCSDGLSGLVKPDEIARLATEEGDVELLCRRLIARANELGGPDNITVISVRFEGDGLVDTRLGDEIGHRTFPLMGALPDDGAEPASRTPFRSDPGPAYPFNNPGVSGTLDDEFARARQAEEESTLHVDDDVLEERRRKAQPVMIALVLLAAIAVVWTLWRLFSGSAPPTASR